MPKEVCVRVRTNPRTIKKPVIKKWCYTPTEESGLARSGRNNPNLKLVPDVDVNETDAEGASVSTVAPELDVGLTEETPSAN